MRLVDAAAAVLTGSAIGMITPPEPWHVLGVGPQPTPREVHSAYRRVSRTVHPDLGGTDELFRLCEGARRAMLEAPAAGAAAQGRAWRPPSPPPPRGPYRAPPTEERHVVPPWRALRDLAWYLSILASTALLVVAGFSLGAVAGGLAVGFVVLAVTARAPILRPALEGALRAGIVLLGARVRVAAAVAPERFLEQTCLDAPVGRSGERELYAAYVRWCGAAQRGDPVAPWVFVERLRTLGLLLVKPSAWDDGLWVGIALRR